VILAPVIFLFLLCAVGMGRFEHARQVVESAARSGAEAAAIAPSATAADQEAREAAIKATDLAGLSCANPDVIVQSADLVAGGGVTVSVQCQVTFSDLLLPGLPGSTTLGAVVVTPIDPYRMVQ
jgi:Flp pilus assembly protein TadG